MSLSMSDACNQWHSQPKWLVEELRRTESTDVSFSAGNALVWLFSTVLATILARTFGSTYSILAVQPVYMCVWVSDWAKHQTAKSNYGFSFSHIHTRISTKKRVQLFLNRFISAMSLMLQSGFFVWIFCGDLDCLCHVGNCMVDGNFLGSEMSLHWFIENGIGWYIFAWLWI